MDARIVVNYPMWQLLDSGSLYIAQLHTESTSHCHSEPPFSFNYEGLLLQDVAALVCNGCLLVRLPFHIMYMMKRSNCC